MHVWMFVYIFMDGCVGRLMDECLYGCMVVSADGRIWYYGCMNG